MNQFKCRVHNLNFEWPDNWQNEEKFVAPECSLCLLDKLNDANEKLANALNDRTLLLAAIKLKLNEKLS